MEVLESFPVQKSWLVLLFSLTVATVQSTVSICKRAGLETLVHATLILGQFLFCLWWTFLFPRHSLVETLRLPAAFLFWGHRVASSNYNFNRKHLVIDGCSSNDPDGVSWSIVIKAFLSCHLPHPHLLVSINIMAATQQVICRCQHFPGRASQLQAGLLSVSRLPRIQSLAGSRHFAIPRDWPRHLPLQSCRWQWMPLCAFLASNHS